MPLRRSAGRLLVALAACAFAIHEAAAQSAVYPSGTIYDLDPPSTQSTTQSGLLETMIASRQAGRMRPVRDFHPEDLMHRLGRPVGRLAIHLNAKGEDTLGFCTAVLIDEELMLTNHHCLADNPSGRVVDALLWMGYLAPRSREGVRQYGVDVVPVEANPALDYAIHRVRGRPGRDWGTVRLAADRAVRERQSLFVVHHPAGRSQHVSLACASGEPAVEGDDLLHQCDTLGGSSGAPVFDNETRTMVGLHYTAVIVGELNAAKTLAAIRKASPILTRLTQPVATISEAARVYGLIASSADRGVLESFVAQYPKTPQADAARARIAALTAADLTDTAPPKPSQQANPTPPTASEEAASPQSAPQRQAGVLKALRADAKAGDARAMRALGRAYFLGEGVTASHTDALAWFQKAAEAGYPVAMNDVGYMFDRGHGADADKAAAVTWYRKAAERGHLRAMLNLGLKLSSGEGVAQDEAAAVGWFRKAAEGGLAPAMHSLALRLSQGRGADKDIDGALRWFRRAAERGHPNAMHSLGLRYAAGRGVTRDATEAVDWFRKASEAGNPLAMVSLGGHLLRGDGVALDKAAADALFQRAARRGGPALMHRIGILYAGGPETRDDEAAVAWFRRAADKGHVDARLALGLLTIRGKGVAQDASAGAGLVLDAVAEGAVLVALDDDLRAPLQRALAERGGYDGPVDGSDTPAFGEALAKLAASKVP
ncbi:MAG: bifunctional trypsin-like peptidase domain-containing/SEL1-like repeat protein [Pseudomonadota bacterium]